jgi:hypothetical protein
MNCDVVQTGFLLRKWILGQVVNYELEMLCKEAAMA